MFMCSDCQCIKHSHAYALMFDAHLNAILEMEYTA